MGVICSPARGAPAILPKLQKKRKEKIQINDIVKFKRNFDKTLVSRPIFIQFDLRFCKKKFD